MDSKWVKGLLAAVISGAASGVLLTVADPQHFNLTGGGAKMLLMVSAAFGLVAAANYLKQAPVPQDTNTTSPSSGPSKVAIALLTAGLMGTMCLPLTGCGGKTPPVVAPSLTNAQKAVAVLDVIRDTAVSANANKVLSDADTRIVVDAHEALVKVINASAAGGWKSAVDAGLDSLKTSLPAKSYAVIAPYVDAARLLIDGLVQ